MRLAEEQGRFGSVSREIDLTFGDCTIRKLTMKIRENDLCFGDYIHIGLGEAQ